MTSWKNACVAAIGLVVAGMVVGAANNLLAGGSRRLDWFKQYAPKTMKDCRNDPHAVTTPGGGDDAGPGVPGGAGTDPASGGHVAGVVPPGLDMDAPPEGTMAAAGSDVAAEPLPPKSDTDVSTEVTSAQARGAHEAGALFVDARLLKAYEEGHVAGAIQISQWESGFDEKIAAVPFDAKVQGNLAAPAVVYCTGGDCEDSHAVARKLWESGMTQVYIYKDGYPDWLKHGRATTKGAAP